MTQAKETPKTQSETQNPGYLWLSGSLVHWDDATVHVTQIGWTAISAVFEGIRGYWNEGESQLYLFRLEDHLARLRDSMKLMRMACDFSDNEIVEAIIKLLRANE